jgi:hypothetical protein
MKSKWKIIYYTKNDNSCPVKEFINNRKPKNKAKILTFLELLEEKGPNLLRPYADILEDGIHEIRIKLSGDQIRILYFFCYKNYIILTNPFIKNTDKILKKYINIAKKYKEDFLKRYNENDLERFYNGIV